MSINRTLRLAAFAAACGFASPLAVVQPAAATVLATVNGQPITGDDLKIASEDLGSGMPRQLDGKARDAYMLDYLIDGKLVVEKALAEKLDQDPEFAKKLAYYHDKLLMEEVLGKAAKAATDDDKEMHKVYDEAAKAQAPEPEVHARHILLATEADAQAALKRVKAGEDFAKVAAEVTKDPGSKDGDLGWFTKDRMVAEFADAAFKLEPGQISEPVKSQFGWHIIKVEEKRMKTFPPYDEVKEQVAHYVVQKAQSDLIVKLRANAKIERTAPEAPAADEATPDQPKK